MNFPLVKKIMVAATLLTGMQATAQKMITFDANTPSSSHSSFRHKKYEAGKNSISMGIASAINGYTPFYYERTVTSFLTLQVGAGITYRSFVNDIGMVVYEDGSKADYFNGGLFSDISDDYSTYQYRKMSIGQYFSFSPKFYLRDDVLDGGYIGPMIEYKNYKYKAKMADETASVTNWYGYDDSDVPRSSKTMNEHMRCIDLTFQVGGHFQTRSHVAVGWSVGVGARSLSAERLDVGIVRDSYDSNSEEHFANATRSYTETRPLFVFNFVMGGWF